MQLNLSAGMKPAMDFFKAVPINVGIDLSRGDVGMAEHLLDHPQIGSLAEEMSSKAVPKGVGAHLFSNSGFEDIALDQTPQPLPAHTPPPR